MDLADHARVIISNWWRILLIALACGVLTFAWRNSIDRTYEAAQLLSVANQEAASGQPLDPNQLSFRAEYFAAVGRSDEIAAEAAKSLDKQGYDLSADTVKANLSWVTNDEAFILVRGTGGSVKEAADLTSAASNALIDNVRKTQDANREDIDNLLRGQIANLQVEIEKPEIADNPVLRAAFENQIAALRVQLQQNAAQTPFALKAVTVFPVPNETPISPKPLRDALFVFALALIVSAEGFVVARALSDRFARTNDVEQIASFTGLPVLAMVPRGRGGEIVEAFRTLRTNLMFLEGAGRPRTIALVSPNPAAGKSFTAIHLAESAVAVDASVVVIDADMRRPVLHERLLVDREPGLSDALRGRDVRSCLHKVDSSAKLMVLPSGSPVADTVGVLGGRAFRAMLDALDEAELVIVDTPPGAVYADALAVAAQCDATLLVLDARSTRRRPARQLLESLERTGATMIGVVVNNASVNRRDTYGYDRA